MSKQEKVNYSPEFKREAVRLLIESDKPGAQLARELGVRRNRLYKWKTEIDSHGDEAFPGHGKRPQQQDDTEKLKKELKKLREENEILKKAAVYFAREIK